MTTNTCLGLHCSARSVGIASSPSSMTAWACSKASFTLHPDPTATVTLGFPLRLQELEPISCLFSLRVTRAVGAIENPKRLVHQWDGRATVSFPAEKLAELKRVFCERGIARPFDLQVHFESPPDRLHGAIEVSLGFEDGPQDIGIGCDVRAFPFQLRVDR